MKSLYAEYIAEREDKEIIETDKGFATFKIFDNKECYLQDIYIIPECRKTGLATEMTDKIVEMAKEKGCNTLVGSVCVDDKYATRNMKVFLAYGMQIYKTAGTMIFLKKDITNG
jgi:ribosomal protein S18 acetylase RimI-like enzyme